MKIPIEAVRLNNAIQIGASATDSISNNDKNPQRTEHRNVKMELDDATGIVTIGYRGQRKFVHLSAMRFADEKIARAPVEPAAVEVDEDEEEGEVTASPFINKQAAEEDDDMPDDLPGKRPRGRPRKS